MVEKIELRGHKLDGTFEQLFEAGCIQTGCDTLENIEAADKFFRRYFQGIMTETKSNPCSGCPAFNDGGCEAYQIYHTHAQEQRERIARQKKENATRPPGTEKYPGLSVKQIAQQMGISISQVRRLKAQGAI